MVKAIVSLSGGMDSAAVLGDVTNAGIEVVAAVGFIYGSKHNPWEVVAARKIAEHYKVPYELIDLTAAFAGFKSSLLKGQGPVPEGHYEAESMSATVVPARNIIFASILAGIAWSRGAEQVYLGVHAGDHHIYPDCRPEFLQAMAIAIARGTDLKVALMAPYVNGTKVDIIRRGMILGVPFQLSRTCYKDQTIACGKCGSCQERLAAFAANGLTDPIDYESRVLLPK